MAKLAVFPRLDEDALPVLRVAPAPQKNGRVIALFNRQFSMPEVLYPQSPCRRTARHPHFSGVRLADALDGAIRMTWAQMHALRRARDEASELPPRDWQADWYSRRWKSPRQMYAQRAKDERALLTELLELRRAALRPRRAAYGGER